MLSDEIEESANYRKYYKGISLEIPRASDKLHLKRSRSSNTSKRDSTSKRKESYTYSKVIEKTDKSRQRMLSRHKQGMIEKFNFLESTKTMYKLIFLVMSDYIIAIASLLSTIIYILQGLNPTGSFAEWSSAVHLYNLKFEVFYISLILIDMIKEITLLERNFSIIGNLNIHFNVLIIIPGVYYFIFGFQPNFLIFHLLQIVKSLRILKVFRILNSYEDEENRNEEGILNIKFRLLVNSFIISLICVTVICGSVVYEFNYFCQLITVNNESGQCVPEKDNNNCLTFLDSTFYLFEIFSTSPFKDFRPSTPIAKYQLFFISSAFVCFIIYKIIMIFKANINYQPWRRRIEMKEHIVIVGTFNQKVLSNLISSLISLKKDGLSILIVKDSPPSHEIITQLMIAPYTISLDYLHSDVYNQEFAEYSNLKDAKSIIILNDSGIKSEHLLIRALSKICPFTQKIVISQNPTPKFVGTDESLNIQYINAFELRLKFMCMSIHNRGILTVLSNLFLNFSSLTLDNTMSESAWVKSYSRSLVQNINVIPFPEGYMGYTFIKVAKDMYLLHQMIVVGVRKKISDGMSEQTEILINPSEYIIEEEDEAVIITNRQFLGEKLKDENFKMLYMNPLNEDLYVGNIEYAQAEHNLALEIKESLNKEENYVLPRARRVFYQLWRDNLEGIVEGHIVLFCRPPKIMKILQEIKKVTKKPIFWFTNEINDSIISTITTTTKDVFILEGDCLNKKHLSRASLNSGFLALLFNGAGTVGECPSEKFSSLLVNILDKCFLIPYLVDLEDFDELNFMPNKPNKLLKTSGNVFYPQYLSGNCFVGGIIENLASNLINDQVNLQFVKALFGSNDGTRKILTINAPMAFIGMPFNDLFKLLLSFKPSMIPIALVTSKFTDRRPIEVHTEEKRNKMAPRKTRMGRASILFQGNKKTSAGMSKKNMKNPFFLGGMMLPFPLVLLNPEPSTKIEYNDKIILLTNYRDDVIYNSMNEFGSGSLLSSDDCITQRMELPHQMTYGAKRIKRLDSIESLSYYGREEKNRKAVSFFISNSKNLPALIALRREIINQASNNVMEMKNYFLELMQGNRNSFCN